MGWTVRRRPNVEWVNQTDDRILELLGETGLTLTPKIIAHETGYNRDWVKQRLPFLLHGGLISKEGKGLYRITDLGRRYLTGEATSDEIPEPDFE